MISEYLCKIKRAYMNNPRPVPQQLCRFYSLLSLLINKQTANYQLLGHLSNLYARIQQYLAVEQPLDCKILQRELVSLLEPFLKEIGDDNLSIAILKYFLDDSAFDLIAKFRYEISKSQKYGNHEFSNQLWTQIFPNDTILHSGTYLDSIQKYLSNHSFYSLFFTSAAKNTLLSLLDPNKVYFITKTESSHFFFQLMEPANLSKALNASQSHLCVSLQFKSKSQMKLKFEAQSFQNFTESDEFILEKQFFFINGNNVNQKAVKNSPIVLFGSWANADVRIKCKFISRKQFAIIQQNGLFYLICLSNSNFTAVEHNKPTQISASKMIKYNNQTIQILSCGVVSVQKIISNQDNDATIDINTTNTTEIDLAVTELMISFTFISGPRKGEKVNLCGSKCIFKQQQSKDRHQSLCFFEKQGNVYVEAGTKIICKNANQALNGAISSRIALSQGDRIYLDNCFFKIQEII